jgi:hypothetical protein
MREARQAEAGLSHSWRPASWASWRISALVSSAVTSGATAWCRAELAAVVEVHAVGDVEEAAGLALGLHAGEEFVLAVEAAFAVVPLVVGVLELFGVQNLNGNVVLRGKVEGGGQLSAWQRGGVGDDGEHIVAEGLMCGIGEVGGVGSAGVGDEQAAEIVERGLEVSGFLRQIHRGALIAPVSYCSRGHRAHWVR